MKNRNLILVVLGLIGACVCGAICTSVLGFGAFGLLVSGTTTPAATAIFTPVVTTPTTSATTTGAEPTTILATATRTIQRNTPPVVVPATTIATSTPRATATPTAVPPTDTPVPPPPATDTPRPPAPPPATFRLDLHVHEGYERWGAPKNGCQDFDNTRPVKKLTIDVIVINQASKPIAPNDIGVSFFDTAGTELVWCVYTDENQPLPTVPARGQATYVLTTFVEQNQFVAAMVIKIGASSVRNCFARNNRADVVGCG